MDHILTTSLPPSLTTPRLPGFPLRSSLSPSPPLDRLQGTPVPKARRVGFTGCGLEVDEKEARPVWTFLLKQNTSGARCSGPPATESSFLHTLPAGGGLREGGRVRVRERKLTMHNNNTPC